MANRKPASKWLVEFGGEIVGVLSAPEPADMFWYRYRFQARTAESRVAPLRDPNTWAKPALVLIGDSGTRNAGVLVGENPLADDHVLLRAYDAATRLK